MTLLSKIQTSIPTATQAQVDEVLQAFNKTEAEIIDNQNRYNAFLARIAGKQSGLVTRPDGIAPKQPIENLSTPTVQPIAAPVAAVTGMVDRDWKAFEMNNVEDLTDIELDSLFTYKKQQIARLNRLREIAELDGQAVDLQSQNVSHQQTSLDMEIEFKRVAAQLQVKRSNADALLSKTTEVAKRMAENETDRQLVALDQIEEAGKKTVLPAEVNALRAVQRQMVSLNMAQAVINQTPMAIAGAPHQGTVTIDA